MKRFDKKMWSVLAICALSADPKCIAELATPAPVPGKNLKFLQILTRHGARAPLAALLPKAQRGFWLCDAPGASASRIHAAPVVHYRRFKQVLDQRLTEFTPNCRAGDLLLTGMQQHKDLGKLYNDYVYKNHKLLSELPPNPKNIYTRCTDVERTMKSAQSFLHGMFPTQSPNEVMEIIGDTSSGALLRPNQEWCKDMRDMFSNYTSTQDYQKWVTDSWSSLGSLPEYLGFDQPSGEKLNEICDFVTTHHCDDKQMPAVVTEEIVDTCTKVTGSWLYDYYSQNPYVAGSYAMRELVRVASASLSKKSDVKFSLMSSHDTTVAAIYQLLGQRDERIPPYASHLVMEIWESDNKDYVRFALNGKDIPLREFDGETVVLYSDFLEKYGRMNDFCKELP